MLANASLLFILQNIMIYFDTPTTTIIDHRAKLTLNNNPQGEDGRGTTLLPLPQPTIKLFWY